MNKFIVISMYTVDTPYAIEVKSLISSLESLTIMHEVFPIPDLGDWVDNCSQKIGVVQRALKKYPSLNVLLVDADAVFKSYPIYFETFDHDLGFCVVGNQFNSGTMFWANNSRSHDLLKAWDKLDQTNTSWEQVNLRNMLLGEWKEFDWATIPDEYSFIFDNKIQIERIKNDPVIIHNQASRRFKSIINRGEQC